MKELSYSPWRVLIYAANPLIILQFSLDAHVDAFGFPFLIFALLFFAKGKKNLSLVFFGLSLLIKPVAIVILPLLFFHERGLLNKAKTLVIPFVVFFIPFVPYIFSANPFEALTTFTEHWYFNGALFSALYPFFSDNQTTRLWCFAILAVLLAILYLSNKSLHEKMVLAVLLLLLCSPVAHPWYFGWLVLILPLAPLASGLALAALASLPSITFVTYQLNGIWRDYPLILILEYVPVLLLFIWDLRKKPIGMETAG
jgi:Gpi18-like mannosyltransferase